jgi:phosphate/sulfate permease
MLAMLLFATIALQLDVGDVGCVDCIDVNMNNETNLSASLQTASRNSSVAQSRYATSNNNNDSSFPTWIKTTLGVAVVVLGLVLAGRKVISKLFIVKTQSKRR